MAQQVKTNLDFVNEGRIINLPNAENSQDPVTLAQMKAMVESLNWKDDVRTATVSNINLSAPGSSIASVSMVLDDRFGAKDQTTQSQNGIYLWKGAGVPAVRTTDANTFDKLEAARFRVTEGDNAGTEWVQTQVNGVLGTNNVIFTNANATSPAASETTSGIAEIATQAETDAGTDDARIVTPLKLKTSTLVAKMASALIGDGSATQYDLTHGFNTRDVEVVVRRNSSPWDKVIVDDEAPDTNTVRVRFNVAPTANQFKVTVFAKQ